MESMFHQLKGQMEGTSFDRNTQKELIETMKMRSRFCYVLLMIANKLTFKVLELDAKVIEMDSHRGMNLDTISTLKFEKEDLHVKVTQLQIQIDQLRHKHSIELDDLRREHRFQQDELFEKHRKDVDRLSRTASADTDSIRKEMQTNVEDVKRKHILEVADLQSRLKVELEEEQVS